MRRYLKCLKVNNFRRNKLHDHVDHNNGSKEEINIQHDATSSINTSQRSKGRSISQCNSELFEDCVSHFDEDFSSHSSSPRNRNFVSSDPGKKKSSPAKSYKHIFSTLLIKPLKSDSTHSQLRRKNKSTPTAQDAGFPIKILVTANATDFFELTLTREKHLRVLWILEQTLEQESANKRPARTFSAFGKTSPFSSSPFQKLSSNGPTKFPLALKEKDTGAVHTMMDILTPDQARTGKFHAMYYTQVESAPNILGLQDRRKESSNFSSKDSLALSQRGAPKSGRTLTAELNQNSSTTGGSIDKVTVLRMAPITAMPHTEDCLSKENSWEEAVASSYKVRGLNYMTDRKKYDSQDAAYRLLGIELLASTDQNKHISARQGSFVQRYQQAAGNNAPFLLVLNFVLPFGNFLAYFCPNTMGKTPYIGDEKFDSLLRRFIEGSNDFRDKRLKIMPRCVEGPWMVVHAVGGKPAIMGTKIKHNYYSTERYFEIEVDIMTSKAAGAILNAVKNYTNSCSIELAFVLQGENTSELPERVLGCLRFHQLDVVGAVSIDSWEKR